MLIYPAIDLLDGRCVRLKQGGFDRGTVYSDDPIATARRFEEAGATHLHLVDLSGARDPSQRQTELIARLLSSSPLRVQMGGGLRDFDAAAGMLALGADRVVIGSAAVASPALVLRLLSTFGGARVTVALDVRIDEANEPRVALHGWKDQSAVTVTQALAPLLRGGLERVLCTDISRDGMMTGPNNALYMRLMAEFPGVEIQASGGVGGIEDLRALESAGVPSAIVGRALYEGAIDLSAALTELGTPC